MLRKYLNTFLIEKQGETWILHVVDEIKNKSFAKILNLKIAASGLLWRISCVRNFGKCSCWCYCEWDLYWYIVHTSQDDSLPPTFIYHATCLRGVLFSPNIFSGISQHVLLTSFQNLSPLHEPERLFRDPWLLEHLNDGSGGCFPESKDWFFCIPLLFSFPAFPQCSRPHAYTWKTVN